MTDRERLREMIAASLGVQKDVITDDYSLRVGKFRTSAGSVILGNMIGKIYGKKINCKVAKTFAELVTLAEDEAVENIGETETGNVDIGEYFEQGVPVCGIDIQEIAIFPEADDYWSESFYTDSFTPDEIAYCVTAESARHSFAVRWCLKEALHKCGSKYYHIPFRDIQVVAIDSGEPRIEIRDKKDGWIRLPFACSVSHADNYAVGMITGFRHGKI